MGSSAWGLCWRQEMTRNGEGSGRGGEGFRAGWKGVQGGVEGGRAGWRGRTQKGCVAPPSSWHGSGVVPLTASNSRRGKRGHIPSTKCMCGSEAWGHPCQQDLGLAGSRCEWVGGELGTVGVTDAGISP